MARPLAIAHDIFMAVAALYAALLLRYGFDAMPPADAVLLALAVFGVFAAVGFRLTRLGRGIWRFTSLSELRAIVMAATITVSGFLLAMFLINRLDPIPRSVPIIAWFVLVIFLAAPRIFYRVMRDAGSQAIFGRTRPRDGSLLVVGSPDDADRFARGAGYDRDDRTIDIVGIVDVFEGTQGRSVRGIPILGQVDDCDAIIARLADEGRRPAAMVIAAPRENRAALQAAAAAAARAGLPIKRIAEVGGVEGKPTPTLQPATLEDLLGRPQVSLDLARIRKMVAERTVLITGAGGSIGSEISRQVAALGPRRLVLLDCSEFNLYLVDRLLGHEAAAVERAVVIGSVRDRSMIQRLFGEEKPDIVFHAAALKHVPLVEANVCEGVLTNVEGTRIVADAAAAAGARALVMISTDKAIRPSSVMGASKRAAECYCQAIDATRSPTRLITVRFGNVLGSTGSVVPLFEGQIRNGGPVTVTHPEMRRYFMTIRESTELVLQAAAHGLAHPEETGRIHVLDMGKPIRIVDLARTMVALAGLKPDEDIEIRYVGIRPGEKLFEEYFDGDEDTVASTTPGVLLASPRLADRNRLVALLDRLSVAAVAGDEQQVRALLNGIVRESSPSASAPIHAALDRYSPAAAGPS